MNRISWILLVLVAIMLTGCGGKEERRDEFLKSAQTLFEEERYEESLVQARNVLKVDRKFAPGYIVKAKNHYALKQWRDAMGNYTSALEIDETLTDAMIGQSRIHLLFGNLDKAEIQADKVLAILPNDPDGVILKASVLARKGDRDAASAMVEELLTFNPRHEDAYAFLSLVAFQQGDTDKSISVLETGLVNLPASEGLTKQLASMYSQTKRFDEAESLYKKLVANNAGDFDLQRMLLRFYFDSGRGEKAKGMAAELVKENPDDDAYALINAEVLGRVGDTAGQIAALKKGVVDFAPGYDLRLALIQMLLTEGDLDAARTLATETAEIEPTEDKALVARRMLADILVREVKYDEAEAVLEKLFEYSPGDMEAKVFMGRVALAKGDALKAIGLFRQVMDEQPDLLSVYGHLSQAHYINGETGLAKETLVQALRVKPDFTQARNALINLYLADEEFDRALSELRDVARQNPKDLGPVASMGDVFLMQEKYTQAVQRYRRLLKMEGGAALGLYKLGQLETRREKYNMALDYFGQLLAGAPQAFQAAEAIVGVYLLQKQYGNAMAFCDKLLEGGPNPGAYDLKARVEAARGKLAKAEALFFKAKEIEPRWRDPYQMVGAMYLRAGKPEVAVQKFKQALKESPENIGNAYVLGMLYQEQGKIEEAAEMYEYVLERDMNFLPAVNNLAYLYADSYTEKDKLNRALSLALRAAGRSSSATLDTLGWVYFKTGNSSMALSTLLRAMEMDNEDPVIILHLAQVHAAMGAVDQARSLAEKVVDFGDDVPEKKKAEELLKSL